MLIETKSRKLFIRLVQCTAHQIIYFELWTVLIFTAYVLISNCKCIEGRAADRTYYTIRPIEALIIYLYYTKGNIQLAFPVSSSLIIPMIFGWPGIMSER
jgi:hypothetical protein